MSRPADRPTADRNLLFGILALQMGFLSRDALIAAMHAWVLDKAKPLGQILLEQEQLTGDQLQALDGLIVQHLKAHGGDPERSLQALAAGSTLPVLFTPVVDADVQASLETVQSRLGLEDRGGSAQRESASPRFQVLHFHKSGGLGLVSVAADTELHREVALKEIKPEYADDLGCRCRFLLEAEITGGLEHPGIVPVYGLGAYANGRPYYAMRFIRGDNLKDAIQHFHDAAQQGTKPGERSLALRQLLRRFIDVCNAVAYAHSRGVLHRDIKPGNVMLGKFGETLVVDWGLAKAGVRPEKTTDGVSEGTRDPTLRPSSGSDLVATQAGAGMLGTVGFMSPEQAAQQFDQLTFASDIYSLGCTLYVLLTGRRPFEGTNREEVLAQNRRGEFTPPRQLKPDTPLALDAICRKAMALRPGDRYQTAIDLAADLEHWLGDEPVAAYPEPWTVRAGRWGRRHRTTLVAAAVLLVSTVVALSVSTALIWREEQKTAAQKRLAEQHFELVRDLSFNSIDLIESGEVYFASVPALHSTRKDFLEAAARAYRQYLEHDPNNAELRRRTAQVYRHAAHIELLTNETQAAEPLFHDSIRLYEELAEQYADEAIQRQRLSETLRDFSQLQTLLGLLQDSADTLGRAITIAEQLQADDPNQGAYRRNLAAALLYRSWLEYTRGMIAESGQTAGGSLELLRGLAKLPSEERHAYDPLLLAAALNRLAVAERDSGRLDVARSKHNEAIKELQGMVDKPSSRVNPADVLNFLARYRLEQSRTLARIPEGRANAEKNLGAAIQQWTGLSRDYPKIPNYRESEAFAYQIRGLLRMEDKRLDEARTDFEASRQLLEVLLKEFPQVPGNRADLGRIYAGLGQLARSAGNEPEAAAWFTKAIDALSRAVDQSPLDAHACRSLEEVRAQRSK